MKTALVTGAAGFIGFHVARRWLDEGWTVVGLDAFTEYYDPKLKRDRAAILKSHPGFTMIEDRIEREGVIADLLSGGDVDTVVHLAAQAGVRYSIEAPRSYMKANIDGTFELLEAARHQPPRALLLASTSSVYGANRDLPYREDDRADHQVSLYAATKKSNEAMAHAYAHLYNLPTIAFRFFTVYGPWGRPDMALFKFVKAMLAGEPVDIYNHGKMARDFTYIDDLVEAVWRLGKVASEADPAAGASPVAPYRVVNIGKSRQDSLMSFVAEIETALGVEARKNFMSLQPGDVLETASDTTVLRDLTGYSCNTPLSVGIPEFVSWYRQYFGV